MVTTEWFRLSKADDNNSLKASAEFSRAQYPYFIDKTAFAAIDDNTILYNHTGWAKYDDFIFEPTFLLGERFHPLFELLQPDMEFKSVRFFDARQKENAPAPLYYVPYLPTTEIIHPSSDVVMGKAHRLVLRQEVLARDELKDERVLHAVLPADDIWLFSLEAAECILRRSPMGIKLTQVDMK